VIQLDNQYSAQASPILSAHETQDLINKDISNQLQEVVQGLENQNQREASSKPLS